MYILRWAYIIHAHNSTCYVDNTKATATLDLPSLSLLTQPVVRQHSLLILHTQIEKVCVHAAGSALNYFSNSVFG